MQEPPPLTRWQQVKNYLRNPIIIFAIFEFFVLMGLMYLLLQRKR